MTRTCKFGHAFDGESAFCVRCGERIMPDEHVKFNREQAERKLNNFLHE